jgi:hypothetical protein
MEPRRAQFLIMLGDLGRQAQLAALSVEIVTRDGRSHCGIPAPRETTEEDALDDTGLSPELTIGASSVALDDVVAVRVSSP